MFVNKRWLSVLLVMYAYIGTLIVVGTEMLRKETLVFPDQVVAYSVIGVGLLTLIWGFSGLLRLGEVPAKEERAIAALVVTGAMVFAYATLTDVFEPEPAAFAFVGIVFVGIGVVNSFSHLRWSKKQAVCASRPH